MSTLELTCSRCKTTFSKRKAEHTRRVKAGATKFYCSRRCNTIVNNKKPGRHRDTTKLVSDNRRDEFTPFRYYLARIRARSRLKGESDIDAEYLKGLWQAQTGLCPLTKWALKLPHSTAGFIEHDPRNASLDRIDNKKGYVRGNVRFIAYIANIARADFNDEVLRDFCFAVSHNHLHQCA